MSLESVFASDAPCMYYTNLENQEFDDLLNMISSQHRSSVVRRLRGHKSRTTAGLFNEFSAVLQFPLYFGGNWNAFSECITDLDWLEGENYVLMLSDAEELLVEEDEEIFTLIKILKQACEDWRQPNMYIPRSRKPTAFRTIFQCVETARSSFLLRLSEKNIYPAALPIL